MATTALLSLVAALLRDKQLRKQFNEDSKEVMNRYGLDSDDRRILSLLDPSAIATNLGPRIPDFIQEVEDAEVEEGEFPPASEEYIEGAGEMLTEYPSPELKVYRFRPKRIPIPAGRTISHFELLLIGQSFWRDPEVALKVVTGTKTMRCKTRIFGTLRSSRMHARVSPPGTQATIDAGTYSLTLEVSGGQVLQVGSVDVYQET